MVTLHPSFRRLVLENISKLKSEDLDHYDSLLGLRLQLLHQRSLPPKSRFEVESDHNQPAPEPKQFPQAWREEIDELIRLTTITANKIIAPYRPQFNALHKLWAARRNLALHQGGLLQIPSSIASWAKWGHALSQYYVAQIQALGPLVTYRIKNTSWWQVILIAIALTIGILGLSSLDMAPNGKLPGTIPDSTRQVQPRLQ